MHSLCVLVNIFVQILYITIFKKVIQETDRNVRKRASLTLTQRICFPGSDLVPFLFLRMFVSVKTAALSPRIKQCCFT